MTTDNATPLLPHSPYAWLPTHLSTATAFGLLAIFGSSLWCPLYSLAMDHIENITANSSSITVWCQSESLARNGSCLPNCYLAVGDFSVKNYIPKRRKMFVLRYNKLNHNIISPMLQCLIITSLNSPVKIWFQKPRPHMTPNHQWSI
jgi:hypothetical protein